MNETSSIRSIEKIGFLSWGAALPVSDVEQEFSKGASFLQLPGPTRFPVRPHLELACSSAGIAARVVDGKGSAAPVVVLVGPPTRIVPVAEAPLGISLRDDGKMWVLSGERLRLCDLDGRPVRESGARGYFLQAGAANAVWVLEGSRDIARAVDAHGGVIGEHAWPRGQDARSSTTGSLCRIDGGALHQIDSEGRSQVVPLASRLAPYEQLHWIGETGFITLWGSTFSRYDAAGHKLKSLTLQSIGLTDEGQPFAAGRDGRYVNLWSSSGEATRLPLGSRVPDDGAFSVVAMRNGRSLVHGQDHAAWYRGTQEVESLEVTNDTFRSVVFPLMWNLLPLHLSSATADGQLLLSSASADGLAVFKIDW